VNTPLIAKVGRKVVLTDAGIVLAEHAEAILVAERAALDAVLNVRDHVAAPVLVGTFGSTAAALLPAVVARAHADYPQMRLRSCELDVDDALEAVAHGRVDAAFGLDYPSKPLPRVPGIEIVTLCEERFGLAASPGAYGVRAECRMDLRDAADWNWILPPAETHYGAAMRTVCRQHGFEPAVSHEIIDTAVTLSLAAEGLGVAPVTDMMIGLNSSVPIIRIALRQEIMRTVVLIRPEGSDARPTVRAVTEAVQLVIRADT
jgi:DNA-binding transcriptional LysR family regulator